MIFVAILMLLWLLPTFVFVGAAMMAIPGSFARHDSPIAPVGELAGVGDLGC